AQSIGAAELIRRAIADESPDVRIGALDAAIVIGADVPALMSAALTDRDRQVRSAALGRLVAGREQLAQDAIDNSLRLAVRDVDPIIAQQALTTMAQLGSSEAVIARLERLLTLRSEQKRVRAAAACIGLVERDAARTVELLTPLLDDPSHDVRVAMLPAMASAWAATQSPEQLAVMLRQAEEHAMRRIAATAAFIVLARTEAGRSAAQSALAELAESGPPLVRVYARLGNGLIEGETDGIGFLATLVP
ncbi:MAG: hypothetical protein AAGC55_07900, partial [Myxococcota bacterium]